MTKMLRYEESGTVCTYSDEIDELEKENSDLQSRIKTLESALVDIVKALEYVNNLPHGAKTDRGFKALSKHQELLNELKKDGK
jgi:predicted  nucleic acid-binding Zn-ribbon protein